MQPDLAYHNDAHRRRAVGKAIGGVRGALSSNSERAHPAFVRTEERQVDPMHRRLHRCLEKSPMSGSGRGGRASRSTPLDAGAQH